MRLTAKGHYALRAVLDLTFNSHGRPVRLVEISQRQSISLPYLEQLFRRLRKALVVRSVRGPGGGYVLGRSMDDVSVKEVLLSVGEVINPARDLITGVASDSGSSAEVSPSDTVEYTLTQNYFENLGRLMEEYLAHHSLGDLVRRARGEPARVRHGRPLSQQSEASLPPLPVGVSPWDAPLEAIPNANQADSDQLDHPEFYGVDDGGARIHR